MVNFLNKTKLSLHRVSAHQATAGLLFAAEVVSPFSYFTTTTTTAGTTTG